MAVVTSQPTSDPPRDDELLTVAEAAMRLRISAPSLRRKIASGEVPAVKLGDGPTSPIRVSRRALDTYLIGHTVTPREPRW